MNDGLIIGIGVVASGALLIVIGLFLLGRNEYQRARWGRHRVGESDPAGGDVTGASPGLPLFFSAPPETHPDAHHGGHHGGGEGGGHSH